MCSAGKHEGGGREPIHQARGDRLMESYFNDVARIIDAALIAGERHASWFSAEDSDFVRMNRGKVRQPGSVSQRFIEIRLIHGARHASHSLTLSGDLQVDAQAIGTAIRGLRDVLPQLADDPHLLLPTSIASTRSARGTTLPSCEAIVAKMLDAAAGLDLVGLAAAGPIYRGFANAEGQRNWHVVSTFNLQWSLYHRADKAVKASYSDVEWSDAVLAERMRASIEQLRLISMPPKSLQPGRYRAYLSPAAMHEIVELLAYDAFSARSLETQQSALSRMRTDAQLDSRVQIAEDYASGVAPPFQAEGFARPASVPLVTNGELTGALVSPRTAREFALDANGANGAESPEALSISGGTIAARDALAALDTGLAVGNLWYLNYSDRPAARMTGMTRFATFWVERGTVVGPANVLRFDDTLFRMLGNNLEALTIERELLLSSSTYRARMLTSGTLPGALLSEMNFTL